MEMTLHTSAQPARGMMSSEITERSMSRAVCSCWSLGSSDKAAALTVAGGWEFACVEDNDDHQLSTRADL